MHPLKKSKVERAAGDVRRLQEALDARTEAAPDNVLELEMIAADLRRAKAAWRRHMEEVLAPQLPQPEPEPEESLDFTAMPARSPLAMPRFAGAR